MSEQRIVIKIGGTAGLSHSAICEDLARLWQDGERMVVVHGGSEEATRLGEAVGYAPRFVTSPSGFTSRFTDSETLKIFTMAVNGAFNTELVAEMTRQGAPAFGLSGVDGGMISAQRKATVRSVEAGKTKLLRGDFTGKVTGVKAGVLEALLGHGLLPVVAPLALSEAQEIVTTDADRAAAMVAGALGAEQLVLLTAVPGLLRRFPDERTLVKALPSTDLERALQWAEGRMKKKVLAAREALEAGVKRVVIADGRVPEPVRKALNGAGTVIQ